MGHLLIFNFKYRCHSNILKRVYLLSSEKPLTEADRQKDSRALVMDTIWFSH